MHYNENVSFMVYFGFFSENSRKNILFCEKFKDSHKVFLFTKFVSRSKIWWFSTPYIYHRTVMLNLNYFLYFPLFTQLWMNSRNFFAHKHSMLLNLSLKKDQKTTLDKENYFNIHQYEFSLNAHMATYFELLYLISNFLNPNCSKKF